MRRLTIPEGIKHESIQCDLDNNGRLCIYAKRNIEGESRNIPINFKSREQQQITDEKPDEKQGKHKKKSMNHNWIENMRTIFILIKSD